jgi:hypothetical protein
MRNAIPGPGNMEGATEALAAEIQRRYRSHIRELRIEWSDGGYVLSGIAMSYYGKQIALHEVRRTRRPVVANRMKVIPHGRSSAADTANSTDAPATSHR